MDLRSWKKIGVALDQCKQSGRVFCQPCLDWSERRTRIAGCVGAKLCERGLELGWIKQLRVRQDARLPAFDFGCG